MIARKAQVEEWYRKFGPLIYARCRGLLRDDVLAEDAAQEIFLRLMRCEELPEDRVATAWIHSVTRNHCFNQIRDRGRRAVPTGELPERVGGDLETELDERRFARELFAQVPAATRRPALLYYLLDVPQEEVALRIGVSRRTVSTRMNEFTEKCIALLGARTAELARV
jgi:RNA polymerase sigma-70 factor (ECF subfamily)